MKVVICALLWLTVGGLPGDAINQFQIQQQQSRSASLPSFPLLPSRSIGSPLAQESLSESERLRGQPQQYGSGQKQNGGDGGSFSIPRAILSLALDISRCKSQSSSDCSSNTVYSPLSISSTLTMLLMGQCCQLK